MRVDSSANHITALRSLVNDVGLFTKILPERRIDQISLDELTSLLSALQADRRTPYQLPKLNQVERSLESAGVGRLIAEIRSRKPETSLWSDVFRHAWLTSQRWPDILAEGGVRHTRFNSTGVDCGITIRRRGHPPAPFPQVHVPRMYPGSAILAILSI
jgi:hypothetical protein